MITLETAKKMFIEMIENSEKPYIFDDVWEYPNDGDPFFAVLVLDEDGDQSLPGQFFPSIRKADGSLFQYNLPIPT